MMVNLWMGMMMMVVARKARVEAGRLLPTGQGSDTQVNSPPPANITSHWNTAGHVGYRDTAAHVRHIGRQAHVYMHYIGKH